jgi:hypothetical protein
VLREGKKRSKVKSHFIAVNHFFYNIQQMSIHVNSDHSKQQLASEKRTEMLKPHASSNNNQKHVHNEHTGDLTEWEFLTKTYDKDPMSADFFISFADANVNHEHQNHSVPVTTAPTYSIPNCDPAKQEYPQNQFIPSISFLQQHQQRHAKSVAPVTANDDPLRMMTNSSSCPDLIRQCYNSFFENSLLHTSAISTLDTLEQNHNFTSFTMKARSYPVFLNQESVLTYNAMELPMKSPPNQQSEHVSFHQPLSSLEKDDNDLQNIMNNHQPGFLQKVCTTPTNDSIQNAKVAFTLMKQVESKSKKVRVGESEVQNKVQKIRRVVKDQSGMNSMHEIKFDCAKFEAILSSDETQLPDWLMQFQQSMTPPYLQLNNNKLLLKPLTPYNYFYRDERDNIINHVVDDFDSLPLTVSDFSISKIQHLLYQHWYIDPLKKKRVHRKTHGKISFQTLCKEITDRWHHLPTHGRDFYRTVTRYDDIYYRLHQKTLWDKTMMYNQIP